VAARSKARVCGHSFAGVVGSSFAGGNECLSLVSVVCCQVEVCICVGLITRPEEYIECGVSESDREALIMRRPCPRRGCRTMKNV